MKFFQAVTAFLLPLTVLAAKKSSADKFSQYRTQQLSAAGALKLDDNEYSKLTAAPRDYGVAILLTALESRFGCTMCHEFQPEWELLAKSWTKGDKKQESKLVFGTLDFVNGQKTFQALQLTTAPVLIFFPPTTGPDAKPNEQPSRYDFTTGYAVSLVHLTNTPLTLHLVSSALSRFISGSLVTSRVPLLLSSAPSTMSRSSPPP
jgi:oligosaccharyltransferase complex subunit gamma